MRSFDRLGGRGVGAGADHLESGAVGLNACDDGFFSIAGGVTEIDQVLSPSRKITNATLGDIGQTANILAVGIHYIKIPSLRHIAVRGEDYLRAIGRPNGIAVL